MILKIYLIGLVVCIIWWTILAFAVFEEKVYQETDEKGKESIDELKEVLKEFKIRNIQFTYVILTLIATLLWPIMLPYILYKRIADK